MSDPEQPKKKSWGCLQWGVVIGVIGLLGWAVIVPQTGVIQDGANKVSTANNARAIIMAMKIYAEENGGVYPDSKHSEMVTSNQLFRELFREDIIQDERIFGAKASRFISDGDIGKAPAFDQAVAAGENHWAWVAGQGLKSPGHYPLIFENAIDATWPPKWDPKLAGQPAKGRLWRGNKIMVGFSDNSVVEVKLEKAGEWVTLPEKVLRPRGKAAVPELKVLDNEVGGGASYFPGPPEIQGGEVR